MRFFRIIMILILFCCLGCTTVKVTTDIHEEFSFEKYNTYGYQINHKGQTDSIEIFKEEISFLRHILDNKLTSCGLTQDDRPDLLIYVGYVPDEKYTLIKEPGKEISHVGDIKSSRDSGDIVEAYYQMGALTLDMVDMNKNQLVISMTATNTLRKNERKNLERIESAAEKMFLDLPKK